LVRPAIFPGPTMNPNQLVPFVGFFAPDGVPGYFQSNLHDLISGDVKRIRITRSFNPAGYKFEFFDNLFNTTELLNSSGQNEGLVFCSVVPDDQFSSTLEVFARLKNTQSFFPKIIGRSSFGCPGSVQTILKKELDGGYTNVFDGELKFKYTEEYNSSTIACKVYSCMNMAIPVMSITEVVEHGDNRESIDVAALAQGFYILEVTNEKSEKWLLRFKII
jgi:hypothetical protein